MRVVRLTRAGLYRSRESVNTLELSERLGVIGDSKSERDGSVSLLSREAEKEIGSLDGLCTAKFAANIVTGGLDYAKLTQGARVKIANAELQITRVGKPCYEDCKLLQAGESCPLPKSCAFARVLRGGEIRINDEIIRTNASDDTHQHRSDTR